MQFSFIVRFLSVFKETETLLASVGGKNKTKQKIQEKKKVIKSQDRFGVDGMEAPTWGSQLAAAARSPSCAFLSTPSCGFSGCHPTPCTDIPHPMLCHQPCTLRFGVATYISL